MSENLQAESPVLTPETYVEFMDSNPGATMDDLRAHFKGYSVQQIYRRARYVERKPAKKQTTRDKITNYISTAEGQQTTVEDLIENAGLTVEEISRISQTLSNMTYNGHLKKHVIYTL